MNEGAASAGQEHCTTEPGRPVDPHSVIVGRTAEASIFWDATNVGEIDGY